MKASNCYHKIYLRNLQRRCYNLKLKTLKYLHWHHLWESLSSSHLARMKSHLRKIKKILTKVGGLPWKTLSKSKNSFLYWETFLVSRNDRTKFSIIHEDFLASLGTFLTKLNRKNINKSERIIVTDDRMQIRMTNLFHLLKIQMGIKILFSCKSKLILINFDS